MMFMANNSCKIGKKIAQAKLDELEKALADETAEMNVEKVKKHLESVETLEGNFSQVGFWKLKQKIWARSCNPPMAKLARRET